MCRWTAGLTREGASRTAGTVTGPEGVPRRCLTLIPWQGVGSVHVVHRSSGADRSGDTPHVAALGLRRSAGARPSGPVHRLPVLRSLAARASAPDRSAAATGVRAG